MAEETSYSSGLFKTGNNAAGKAPFLEPGANGGGVDVLYNYPWTLTPPSGRTETPYAVLTEFRVLRSALESSAAYYLNGVAQIAQDTGEAVVAAAGAVKNAVTGTQNGTGEPQAGTPDKTEHLAVMEGYRGLLDFKNPTNFWYQFPYFSDVANEVQSSWTALDILEKAKAAANIVSPALGKGADLAVGAFMLGREAKYPRVGIMDRPKLWQESTFRSINIKFPLFNTESVSDIQKNWDLCYLLLYQNMFNKKDFITGVPPVFYTVNIPGQFFSIGMYVSDLKIYNRGNFRNMLVGGHRRNIPDVFEIDMTLTDMIMPSQNMLSVLLREKTVNVQTQIGDVFSKINDVAEAGEEFLKGLTGQGNKQPNVPNNSNA